MDIISRFSEKIDAVNSAIDKFLRIREPKRLYSATRHLPLAGGKRLRPILAMLSTEAVGEDWKKTIPFAVSLELLHNFTLVHDDIMDRSDLRRGIETVHVKFGEPTAILAGDILFAKSFEVLYELDIDDAIFKTVNRLLIDCIEEICDGQQIDMEFESRKYVSEEEYLEMIEKKTSALFSCATTGGAIIGDGNNREVDSLSLYGRFFGLAFQIWDDYLDIAGEEGEFGKKIGNDIRCGKKTLMIVHATKNADGREKETIFSILGKKDATDEEINEVMEILTKSGSIDYAKKKALHFAEKAKEQLRVLPDSRAKRDLIELVDFAISRER
ncbi:MAG TPA: polyprenyl synthetase family protein [Thermoplasmatales archaeon]|nr:polyprenyl synthetase family protein [Thermoplasmatales archaeon]